MKALSISQLALAYNKKPVISQLNLELEPGEILCLLGPSGCGKTTLLKAIAGLVPVLSGEIEIAGQHVNSQQHAVLPENRGVGMIFQDYALFPHLTLFQNIAFGLYGSPDSVIQSKVQQMMTLVKLDGLAARYPHELSGGQQQRVAIARALATEPKLLLLDEPFSNIDSQVRHQLIQEIRAILKAHGVTAIFVTHSRDEAFAFGDKLALFEATRIAQLDHPKRLYQQPNSRFVAEFMGRVNYVAARVMDRYQVDTVLGTIRSTEPLPLSIGASAQLMLRPSQIVVAEQGVAVSVVSASFMGDCSVTQVDVNGTPLMVEGHLDLQQYHVQVVPHKLVLFAE